MAPPGKLVLAVSAALAPVVPRRASIRTTAVKLSTSNTTLRSLAIRGANSMCTTSLTSVISVARDLCAAVAGGCG